MSQGTHLELSSNQASGPPAVRSCMQQACGRPECSSACCCCCRVGRPTRRLRTATMHPFSLTRGHELHVLVAPPCTVATQRRRWQAVVMHTTGWPAAVPPAPASPECLLLSLPPRGTRLAQEAAARTTRTSGAVLHSSAPLTLSRAGSAAAGDAGVSADAGCEAAGPPAHGASCAVQGIAASASGACSHAQTPSSMCTPHAVSAAQCIWLSFQEGSVHRCS
jgi:hypothetical protein